MALIIELPEYVEPQLKDIGGEAELPRKVLEALVIEAYRQGLISRGKVGELLGLGFHEREALLKERDVPYNHDLEDFEEDLRTMDRVLGESK